MQYHNYELKYEVLSRKIFWPFSAYSISSRYTCLNHLLHMYFRIEIVFCWHNFLNLLWENVSYRKLHGFYRQKVKKCVEKDTIFDPKWNYKSNNGHQIWTLKIKKRILFCMFVHVQHISWPNVSFFFKLTT